MHPEQIFLRLFLPFPGTNVPNWCIQNIPPFCVLLNETQKTISEIPHYSFTKNTKVRLHTNIVLPVNLYASETRSLTLREENKLIIFENTVLKKMFVPKRKEIIGLNQKVPCVLRLSSNINSGMK
jgi:hypothetical protein